MLKKDSVFWLIKIAIIIFSIVPLYDFSYINEYKMYKCYKNKILISKELLQSTNDNEMKGIQTSNLNAIQQGTKNIIVEDILHGIEIGIRETLKSNFMVEKDTIKFLDSNFGYKNILQSDNNYSFGAYAPENFCNLRSLMNVSKYYKNSFESGPLISKTDPMNSNAKLYYTNDSKFMIQIISDDEQQVLQLILTKYFEHFCENPKSLLPKISGLYHMKFCSIEKYIMVTPSVYPQSVQNNVNQVYFLKGVNKKCPANDNGQHFGLLDSCFIKKYETGLKVEPFFYETFVKILKQDSAFLKTLKLTNYHLMLVIAPSNKQATQSQNIIDLFDRYETIPENDIYNKLNASYNDSNLKLYYVMKNVLQKQDVIKKAEKKIKFVCDSTDKSIIQDPVIYESTFLEFITRNVFISC